MYLNIHYDTISKRFCSVFTGMTTFQVQGGGKAPYDPINLFFIFGIQIFPPLDKIFMTLHMFHPHVGGLLKIPVIFCSDGVFNLG